MTPPLRDANNKEVELYNFYAKKADLDAPEPINHMLYPIKFGCNPEQPNALVRTSEGIATYFTQERFSQYALVYLPHPTRLSQAASEWVYAQPETNTGKTNTGRLIHKPTIPLRTIKQSKIPL